MKVLKVLDNKLYTPVVGYRRDGSEVTTIGAIHIGSQDYYRRLQEEVSKHKEGFFEGIKPLTNGARIPPDKEVYLPGLQKLGEAYRTFAGYLGMRFQQDALTYGDWQNADMTLEQLIAVAPSRVLRSLSRMKDMLEKFEAVHKNHPEELARYIKGGALTMLSNRFLQYIAMRLIFGSLGYKAIVEQRNRKLFDVMQPRLDSEDDEFGVIYGARHLDGIDRHLTQNGFTREGNFWVAAWEVTEKPSFWNAFLTVLSSQTEERMKRRKSIRNKR